MIWLLLGGVVLLGGYGIAALRAAQRVTGPAIDRPLRADVSNVVARIEALADTLDKGASEARKVAREVKEGR